ncbi:MAG: 7 8-dihydro-6-hydroxymethylpterin-pyrophosphokinae hppk [Verrucomicrobiales bacterium]|nr:7 8-dihydro-6-hydroxymethylpterin-pyrophosphokinae hppk [Verrucomicrobiales bacterium]
MPSPLLAFVALGSNLGDSRNLLLRAVNRLQALTDHPVVVSDLMQTEPVDCPPGSPPFLNAVAAIQPRLSETPEHLLTSLQQIENELGRRRSGVQNEARTLDLDLIAFGTEVRQSPVLTLPHPRAHLRGFVLKPMAQIAPQFVLPGQSRTVQELLNDLLP